MNQVAEARAKNVKVNLLPERTDMTSEEVQDLINAPTDEVIESTKKKLRGYSDELGALGLNGTVDLINKEISSVHNEGVAQVSNGMPISGKTAKKKTK